MLVTVLDPFDWATEPKVENSFGMRLDTNYYTFPAQWIQDRPGMFTGSGFPMRFADLDGTMIDTYQATTQMSDEAGQTYPATIDALLDRALGPEGYYGAFTANIHTDTATPEGATAIVQAAKARGVPVISAAQLLAYPASFCRSVGSVGTPLTSLGTSHSPAGPPSVMMYGLVYPPLIQSCLTVPIAP